MPASSSTRTSPPAARRDRPRLPGVKRLDASRWPGCHGVRVAGAAAARLGESSGEPLADLEIRLGAPAAPGTSELWSQPLPNGETQRLTARPDGEVVLELGPERRVSLSPAAGAVTAAEPFDWVEAQLVASFILPFVVSGERRLVLHAAAASRDGRALVLAGPGGTGKSSSLVGLVDAGWTPLSEDVCVIDLSGAGPVVWPGPPWIRRRHGEPGPRGAPVLFRTSEKTAWDVGPFRDAPGPTTLAGLVLLTQPVAGARPELTALRRAEAIGALAPHAVWLGDARDAARRLFGPVAEVAARTPVSALRLPVRDDWVDVLVALLD
jgi:hypothetical protein